MFLCPHCQNPLTAHANVMRCPHNHSYDIAKEGYINLLLSGGANHGDNKEMVQARTAFLWQNHYAPLHQAIIAAAQSNSTFCAWLDMGCGEGYYTSAFQAAFPDASYYGVDISKAAVKAAAKQNKAVRYTVASNANLPFADASFDVVTCLFSYCDFKEASRILKEGGHLYHVSVGPKHLHALKAILYDIPYDNPNEDLRQDALQHMETQALCYTFTLTGIQAIWDLFQMTPYFYKTKPQDAQRLKAYAEQEGTLLLEADFVIRTFKNKK